MRMMRNIRLVQNGMVSIRPATRAQGPDDLDLRMMARCIELSRDSIAAGELPFGCVICRDEEVVTEATNRVVRDGDVTRHAEMVAMSEAQRVLGTRRLSRCTLYTNVEPCAMCCYCIRETRLLRRRRPSGRRGAAPRRIFPSTDSVTSLTTRAFVAPRHALDRARDQARQIVHVGPNATIRPGL